VCVGVELTLDIALHYTAEHSESNSDGSRTVTGYSRKRKVEVAWFKGSHRSFFLRAYVRLSVVWLLVEGE